ncbi:MAG: hypothetical protein AAFR61_10655 [Bacteroidota bacterium]
MQAFSQRLSWWGPLLFTLLLGTSAYGQVPGYVGKLTPISVEAYGGPTLGRFFLDNDSSLSFNFRWGVSMERVLSRRSSFLVSFGRFRTETPYEFRNLAGALQLEGWSVGASFRMYSFLRRGNIAPLGLYVSGGIQAMQYQAFDPEGKFPPQDPGSSASFGDWLLNVSLGSQRIFNDHFTFQWGLDAGWLINAGRIPLEEALQFTKQAATNRLRGYFSFNLKAGIGVLLF